MSLQLSKLVDQIEEPSSLNDVAKSVVEMINDPNSDAKQLEGVLVKDPGLVSKILKTSNSAYYGCAGKVSNLKSAIIVLGFNTVKNLAVNLSICELFESNKKIGGFTRKGLWNHSVAVAVCAKMIAKRLNFAEFEDAFMAGIFHDIGMIMEDQYMHNEFIKAMEKIYKEKLPLADVEKEILGFNHMMLGQMVAEKWKLPKILIESIGKHHNPESAKDDYKFIVAIIHLADAICIFKNIDCSGHAINEKPNPKAVRYLNINKEDVVVWIKDLDEELKQAGDFLAL